ncbi:MAG: hypothetical protein [Mu-like cryoconite phage AB09]|nr:MAG: hypothetical protein [Mu-like cryoconite phage AB09]
MLDTRTVEVDGATFEVTQFSATKGMKLLTRLTRILGEPLSVLMADENAEVQKALPEAVKSLITRLDEDEVVDTVKQLLTGVRLRGEGELQFDTFFAGKFGMLFKLLKEIIMVQYGDFLGVLAVKGSGLGKRPAATMKKKTA